MNGSANVKILQWLVVYSPVIQPPGNETSPNWKRASIIHQFHIHHSANISILNREKGIGFGQIVRV